LSRIQLLKAVVSDIPMAVDYRLGAPSRAEQLRKNRDGTAGRPDSAAIVRFDLATRHFDTAAFVRMYYPRIVSRPDAVHGGVWLSPVLNPMPVVDEWAVLSDGTLAIVRGEDYHVDYIDSANRRVSGKKIPFASVRMTLADKRSVIDSSKALRARLVAQGFRISVNAAPTAASGSPDDDAIIITDDEAKSPIEERQRPPVVYVKADELPGVQPTFTTGSVRADAGGTLWIRTIPPSPPPADATYDVLDRTGSIVDRVLVPRNTVIAGFGPSGVVYLYTRDTSGTLTLTRAHDSGRASPSSRGM
ncbi:MAG: hypothetical protein ABJF01_24445, partial [bacterium]